MNNEWQPMDTFPKDGTDCDVLVKLKPEYAEEHEDTKVPIIAQKIKWAMKAMSKEYTYMGSENILSPALEPYAWRLHKK